MSEHATTRSRNVQVLIFGGSILEASGHFFKTSGINKRHAVKVYREIPIGVTLLADFK